MIRKRGWEGGVATIVARRDNKGLAATLRDSEMGRSWVYDYVADVEPDNGAPAFRASFTVHFGSSTVRGSQRRPAEGEQARVIFDPSSKKVEFDRAALRSDVNDEARASDDSFEAIAAAGVASAPTGGSSDENTEGILAARREVGAQRQGLLAAMMSAKRVGDQAEVERLKAEFDRVSEQRPE